ncbi:biotin/lipoyl-containing protein [Pelosinus sp. sgz500959]|uniref:biotin/lipoyl-containing protein n=1 Tax=Pelosinus sp. sgz500959 TaxID=3242472 RepID=UPI00366BA3DD
MFSKKLVIIATVVLVLIASSLMVTANAAVDQIGVLSGKVIYLLAPGTAVREGDILVKVDTLTGPVTAARATTNGVVAEVLVKSGDSIKIGDVVARIRESK